MATHRTHGTIQFIPLSPLDNIMPRVYTRIILCIQTEKTANPSAITALLSKALRKTVEQVPFLDGEVVPDTTTNTDRLGRFAVRVSQPGRLQLQSKHPTEKQNDKKSDGDDHGDEWKYSFRDLAKENWQPWLFDGNILAPVAAFPDPFDEMPPVMAAKATFIEGGLLLCVAFHHKVMDGTGVGTLIRLWAQNCREIETLDNNVAKNIDNVVDNDTAKTMEKLDLNMPKTVEKVDQNAAEKIDNVDNNVGKQVENVDKTADEVMEKNTLAAPTNSAIVITPEALDRTPLMSSRNKTEDDEREGSRQHPEYAVDTPSISPSRKPNPNPGTAQLVPRFEPGKTPEFIKTSKTSAQKGKKQKATKDQGTHFLNTPKSQKVATKTSDARTPLPCSTPVKKATQRRKV
ncbi:unnamed protein product [Calypogeia fissa]